MAPKKAKAVKEPKPPKEPKVKRPKKVKIVQPEVNIDQPEGTIVQPELKHPKTIEGSAPKDMQEVSPPPTVVEVVLPTDLTPPSTDTHAVETTSAPSSTVSNITHVLDVVDGGDTASTTTTPSTTTMMMPPPTFGGGSVCERILDPSLLASQCPEIAPWLLPQDYIQRCATPSKAAATSLTQSTSSTRRAVPPLVDPVMRILLSRGFLVPSKKQQKKKDASSAGLLDNTTPTTTITTTTNNEVTTPFNVPLPLTIDQVELHRDLLHLYSADNAFRDGEGTLVLEVPVSTVRAAVRDALLPHIQEGRPVTILLFAMYQTPNAAAIRGLIEEVCVGGPLGSTGDEESGSNRLVIPIVVGGDVEPMPAVCGEGSPPLLSFPGARMYSVLTVLREIFDIGKQSPTTSPTRVLLFSDAYTVVRTAVKHAVTMEGLFDDDDDLLPASSHQPHHHQQHPKVVVEHFPLLMYSGPTFGMPYTIQKSRRAVSADGDDATKWANPAIMEAVVSRGMTGYHMRHLAYYLRGLIHKTHH